MTIDRDGKVGSIEFDREEYLFKLALQQKDSKRLRQIVAYDSYSLIPSYNEILPM